MHRRRSNRRCMRAREKLDALLNPTIASTTVESNFRASKNNSYTSRPYRRPWPTPRSPFFSARDWRLNGKFLRLPWKISGSQREKERESERERAQMTEISYVLLKARLVDAAFSLIARTGISPEVSRRASALIANSRRILEQLATHEPARPNAYTLLRGPTNPRATNTHRPGLVPTTHYGDRGNRVNPEQAGSRCTPSMRAAIVFLPRPLFRRPPLHLPPASYLPPVPFSSLLPDRASALGPGTRLLPDREAIDRRRARRLPPKGRPTSPAR